MSEITVTLPLFVDLERKKGKPKRCYLTFNAMKQQHYMVYNQCKHAIHDIIKEQLSELPVFEKVPHPCRVTCTYFPTGERICDIDNAFIAVKFANDALVSLGYLTADDYRYVKEVLYLHGGNDKSNPRYEVKWTAI